MSGSSESLTPNDDLSTVRKGRRRAGYSGAVLAIVAVVLLVVGLGAGIAIQRYVLGGGGSSAPTVTITETGSSLIYPYLQILSPNFTKVYPNVQLSPASTGSGTGISSAESGVTDMGGTDAYISNENASNYNLLNFPIAISAQILAYNIPGVTQHLNLNGSVLAMIYQGSITKWNDPLIQAANPGVSLPSHTIQPIHRSDGSGDTALFTELCFLSWSGWKQGYGTTVSFPVGPGATGNPGMVTTLTSTQYGIAYIGISYLDQVEATSGLGYAALGDQNANYNGVVSAGGAGAQNYILPTPQNLSQDANLALQNLQPPSVAICLILGGVPGATNLQLGKGGTNATTANPTPYPDTNLEYLLISTHAKDTSHQKYVVEFLEWSLAYGATYAPLAHFLPLTPAVIGYDMLALNAVQISA